jgi:hypothetical protein
MSTQSCMGWFEFCSSIPLLTLPIRESKESWVHCKERRNKRPFTPQELSSKVSIILQTIGRSPTLNLSALDIIADILWTSSINLTTNAECSSENLLDRTLQFLRQRLESHCSRNFDDFFERDGLAVLDVLLLLPVARRLLQGLDDKR